MMNFHNFIMRNADGYSVELRCYSVAFFGKISADKVTKINRSDKCILPESMLDTLTRMNVPFPMLFKVERKDRESGRATASTHVGVMEFIAEEGRCYLPHWVMEQLKISENGAMCTFTYRSMRAGTFAKFRALTPEFHDLHDQRAVLETLLGPFSCLTIGDIIPIEHADHVYKLLVTELKPESPVRIAECNVAFDIEPPEGMAVPEADKPRSVAATPLDHDPHELALPPEVRAPESSDKFVPFASGGRRLDGKKNRKQSQTKLAVQDVAGPSSKASSVNGSTYDVSSQSDTPAGMPELDYVPGKLVFIRDYIIPERLVEMRKEKEVKDALERAGTSPDDLKEAVVKFKTVPFSGAGRSLR